jgi:DHA2 family methylenomycin A resistance protein-like MFS transporter
MTSVAPSVPLTRRHALTLPILCLAVLIAQVDTSVVNLAVRFIGMYFAADVDALQWVVDSYNLLYAVLLLTGGLLADLYGRRLLFIVGRSIIRGSGHRKHARSTRGSGLLADRTLVLTLNIAT